MYELYILTFTFIMVYINIFTYFSEGNLIEVVSCNYVPHIILLSIASERSGWSNEITWPDVVKKVVGR